MIGLQKDKIDFSRNLIFVADPQCRRDPRKTKGNSMSQERGELLVAICAESISEHIFSLNGKPLTKDLVDHAFRHAVQRAELEGIHFHTLRHEFGSRLGDMDVYLVKIARLMGHSNNRQTRVYRTSN